MGRYQYRDVTKTKRVLVTQVVWAVETPREEGIELVISVYEDRFIKPLMLLEEIHVTRQRAAFAHSKSTSLQREKVVVKRLDSETRQWVPEML